MRCEQYFFSISWFGGSTHDAYTWNNCSVCTFLTESNFNNTWLLEYSAYPLKAHLTPVLKVHLIPVLTPITAAERRYNFAHRRTCRVIMRTYGVCKMRIRCLNKSGGYLMYSLAKIWTLFAPQQLLHNICIKQRISLWGDKEGGNDDGDDGGNDDSNGKKLILIAQICLESLLGQLFCHPKKMNSRRSNLELL